MDAATTLARIVGAEHVLTGEQISADFGHDESLGAHPQLPAIVVRPANTAEVAGVIQAARAAGLAVTARGAGTGLSGACQPAAGGLLISFERMARVLEVDTGNHVAVVQPGVSLQQLDAVLAPIDMMYPVRPGDDSASLGGNVATNAGGMRAVKYGVTRHQVLGLEAVLGTGEVIRTGGRYVKGSTGYDLTQLVIGSEGTLAIVTEATVRVYPRLQHAVTVLAPFRTLDEVTAAVPAIVLGGLDPVMCEYIDMMTMAAITSAADLHLGVPAEIGNVALAYLVVQLEAHDPVRLEQDTERLGELLTELQALDVYVLPGASARQLVEARERAFFTAKAAGADDIVDVVVPRAQMSEFLAAATDIGKREGSLVVGCGHAGDGNVHLSIFQPDAGARDRTMRELFKAGLALGGTISGEHGIGRHKRSYFLELEDPAKIALMRRIKRAFDPASILNPEVLL